MEKDAADLAAQAVRLLEENKCLDCELCDMHTENRFADYAVIGTYTSQSHLRGVSRYLEEWMNKNAINPQSRPGKGEKWFYWDCGSFVVNLMDKESRSFYNLEDLYKRPSETD